MNLKRIQEPSLVVLAVLAAAGCGSQEAGGSPPAEVRARPAEPMEAAKLIGKWLRPDGGYVLDIRGTSADGLLDAGYSNPNPIHVSAATWQRKEGSALAVFVELRDKGYPGATYDLQYRAADDALTGTYTQPAAGQTFEVEFTRLP